MNTIWVLHGPNLNRLGSREPDLYGAKTLSDIDRGLGQIAKESSFELVSFQSNSESVLIEKIHSAGDKGVDFIVFNPAAFTHTSIALRDALASVAIPFIEVHLTNIFRREAFRHHSYFSDLAVGVISGLGADGYEFALRSAMAFCKAAEKSSVRAS